MNLEKYIRFIGSYFLILILLPSARGEEFDDNRIKKNYGIIISGSWNSLRNEKLNNDYINILRAWGYLDDEIKSGYGLSTEIFYYFSRKFSIGIGMIYISGSSAKDRMVMDHWSGDSISVQDYMKTRLYAPTISFRYHIYLDKTDFSLGIIESFLIGKASRYHAFDIGINDFVIFENDFHSNGIGFQFFGGIHYRLNNIISYIMEAGYRHFETGDLIEKETDWAMRYGFGYITEPINLDYSGHYISAGLMFRLF